MKKKNSRKPKVPSSTDTKVNPGPIVGIIAPSAPVPEIELMMGATRLAREGFEIALHPQVKNRYTFYAGTDLERALAFLDYAFDPDIEILWAGRGGYGAIRILPILDEIIAKVGVPEPKTFIGFSDQTILLEYVRKKWGWRAIHGPMPGTSHLDHVKGKDFKRLVELARGIENPVSWKLKPVHVPASFQSVQNELAGGNLTMIQSVFGTPYALDAKGKILFLEEITEAPYRMDRTLQQLNLAGFFENVRAIVLGTFTGCEDSSMQVRADYPPSKKMKPLRKVLNEKQVLHEVFGALGEELGIPVYSGLPVGHGPKGTAALTLGRSVTLKRDGLFST